MKTKYKLILLVLLACLASVGIYYWVEKAEQANYVTSLVEEQQTIDKEIMGYENYTLEEPKIILNPYGISPLTALIIFETNDYTSPTITVLGKDDNTTITNTFKANKTHYITVYGLYPDTNNEVILTVNGKSKTFYIKTDKLPEDFILPTSIKNNKEELGNELYFISPSSKGYTAAYDVNGDARWYLTTTVAWDIKRLDNGHLLISTNRLINPPYYTTGLYEIDLLGKIYFEYSLPGGYHHDVVEMPNGNLLVASDDFANDTVEDYIVEVNRGNGKIVKTIDLKKLLPMDQGNNYDYSVDYDWFHNNSIWYDERTDSLTISGRHKDSIVNIDYTTLQINYIIGDPTNWDKEYLKYFFTPIDSNFEWQYAQHAAMMLPNGDIFLFDNGNNKTKNGKNPIDANNNYSRGVIYNINMKNMTIKQVWEYGKELGSTFYSPYISDVDYLDKDHYIVHSGGHSELKDNTNNVPAGLTKYDKLTSTTVEIKDNQEIFKMILPSNSYRVEKLSVYSNDVFYPTKAIRLGNMGETNTSNENVLLAFNKDAKDIIKKYNIKINKEIDRLAITGTFNKDDDVTIILDNVFTKKIYDMVISTKPYTSMCVDIFNTNNDKGITVTKYINNLNLSGKYYIYMKINNTIYDFDLYVTY